MLICRAINGMTTGQITPLRDAILKFKNTSKAKYSVPLSSRLNRD